MINIIRGLLTSLFVVIALFFIVGLTSGAEAKASDGTGLQQAFIPKTDTVTREFVARVDNWSGTRFSGFVCATEVAGGRSYHLGCLKPDLFHLYTGEPGAIQFGVFTKHGGTVRYTYQDESGAWRAVRSTTRI